MTPTNENRPYISNSSIDESVLLRPHYTLATFTDKNGNAYAINTNNNYAYPIIGKRKSEKFGLINTSIKRADLR